MYKIPEHYNDVDHILAKNHVCIALHFHNDPEPAWKGGENGLFMTVTLSRMGVPNKQKAGVTAFYATSKQVKRVLWEKKKTTTDT